MQPVFIKPSVALAPYIERYWIWDNDTTEDMYMPLIPPGIGIDLFIHYRSPFAVAQKGKLSSSHIIYSGEKPCNILPMARVGFVAVRFRGGMFKNFTNIPFALLADSYADIENIWGQEGKNMCERICDTRDINDIINHLETFLTKCLTKHKKENILWNHIIQELYYNHTDVTLSELSQSLKISYRHFRRKCIEETGFTPKQFQQLARFRSVLKPLLIAKEKKYLPLALDNGYFDQNHFIKEFKRFTNYTPAEFLQEKNFMSHFYYPSL